MPEVSVYSKSTHSCSPIHSSMHFVINRDNHNCNNKMIKPVSQWSAQHVYKMASKHFISARCNIYTSRAYATMSVSVCLSVCLWHLCIVVTGCVGSRIPLHTWMDGCLCYLLTTPHPDHRMGWCRDFCGRGGGDIEKLVIVAISLIFYRWTRNTWRLWLYEWCWCLAFFLF